MNTPEIERLVADALKADAEDAMNRTDTPEQLETFLDDSERDGRKRRLQMWGAAAAVAAAVATVGIVVATTGGEPDAVQPVAPPGAPSVAELRAEGLRVSREFVEALAAFDRDKAASLIAPDADPAKLTFGYIMRDGSEAGSWELRNRFDEATGWKVTSIDECVVIGVRNPEVEVRCEYTAHQLGSEQLGRGPFDSSNIFLSVDGGAIIGATLDFEHQTNGYSNTMYEPFWVWMDANHPGDGERMAVFEEDGVTPNQRDESLQLWTQRVQEYVAAVQAGQAE